MSMEPVFAAFFAVLLGGESVTVRMLLGGAMVLAAMVIVELVPRRRIEAEVRHLAVEATSPSRVTAAVARRRRTRATGSRRATAAS